jgi:hypothetical protein
MKTSTFFKIPAIAELGAILMTFNVLSSRAQIPYGLEFRVNTFTQDDQFNPQITSLQDGGFVVCWESDYQDGSSRGIYGQRYAADGTKAGEEFRVNTYTQSSQGSPKIALLQNGGFVFCWTSYGQDGSEKGIYAKRFPASPLVHQLIPFQLLSPNFDMTVNTTEPVLVWQQPSSQIVCYPWELKYKIYYDTNPDFSSPEIREIDQDTTITLENLQPGATYFWKVLAKNIAGDSLWSSNTNAFFVSHTATKVEREAEAVPDEFMLYQNYPNPFNPTTTISYELPLAGQVVIKIYDIDGRLVKVIANVQQPEGTHSIQWDGTDFNEHPVAAGVYICRLEFITSNGEKLIGV